MLILWPHLDANELGFYYYAMQGTKAITDLHKARPHLSK